MIVYYMSKRRPTEVGYWKKCKATTPIGAKREATAEYGDGYLDTTLVIAVTDDVLGGFKIIASRQNTAGSRWRGHD